MLISYLWWLFSFDLDFFVSGINFFAIVNVMSSPLQINTSGDRKSILESIMALARDNHVTDIHIPHTGICYMRRSNVLEPVMNALTGEPFEIFEAEFTKILGSFKFERYQPLSKRLTFGDVQLRALYISANQLKGVFDELLILRVQPLTPPVLSDFIENATVKSALLDPHGLILVTGMIGSGKTSLASSVCASWVSEGRHIFTVEDPIEYYLTSDRGRVTQLSANLVASDVSFESAALLALRADIDGLFIGECRNAATFRVCLDAATTHEPCITTLHSGGFADALTRALSFAQQTMPAGVAEFALSQALHSIVHVSLAYGEDGMPIPMVAVLPFWSSDKVRKMLIESCTSPVAMLDHIRHILRDGDMPGVVGYDAAAEVARLKGATEDSIRRAKAYSPELPSYLQD